MIIRYGDKKQSTDILCVCEWVKKLRDQPLNKYMGTAELACQPDFFFSFLPSPL